MPVLIILASQFDETAPSLVNEYGRGEARVLTAADLSHPGWEYHLPDGLLGPIVLDGEPMPVEAISGVVTRLHAIDEDELPHFAAEDRAYAAAEMTAFLTCWLTCLPCPVFNRPSPPCLTSPPWHQDQWLVLATKLGIPSVRAHHTVGLSGERTQSEGDTPPPYDELPTTTITVVGGTPVGACDGLVANCACRLADAVGANALVARFVTNDTGFRFLSADPWPDLRDASVVEAVRTHLAAERRRRHPLLAG